MFKNLFAGLSMLCFIASCCGASNRSVLLRSLRQGQRRTNQPGDDNETYNITNDGIVHRVPSGGDESSTFTVHSSGCLGTWIHPGFVLTVARCAESFQVGTNVFVNTTEYLSGGYQLNIRAQFIHPKYDPSGVVHDNDIMILKLNDTTSNGIKPVKLNRFRAFTWLSSRFFVLAFLGFGGLTATEALNLKSGGSCRFDYGHDYNQMTMLCTGQFGTLVIYCSGQTGTPYSVVGSPLLTERNVQHGIVAFRPDVCYERYATTRVSRYFNWIWKTVCDNSDVKTGHCRQLPF